MKKGLVSVIIPTFNRGERLLKALRSLKNQSYSNWECIIIDDGSAKKHNDLVQKCIAKEAKITFLTRSSK